MENFFKDIQNLESKGKLDDALDIIYSTTNDLVRYFKAYDLIDDLLINEGNKKLSIDLGLGLLIASAKYKNKLKNYEYFKNIFKDIILVNGEDAEEILKNI